MYTYSLLSVIQVQIYFDRAWSLYHRGASVSRKACQRWGVNLTSLLKERRTCCCAPYFQYFSSPFLSPSVAWAGTVCLAWQSLYFLIGLVFFQVVEFCNASTHNQEAPNLQNQMCSLRSTWDVISDSTDFSRSFPMNGTELPPPPTFSLVQAGDKVVCLVLDVSSKMAEVTF